MTGLRRLPNAPAHRLLPSLRRLPALAALLAVAVLACLPSTAAAAPDITMEKLAPATVLYGKESPVRLRVTNPGGQPRGYNLTIRDVLPEGIDYVPGSATYGSTPVEPTVVQDEPSTGETTLIFDNVSDLSPNSTFELAYRVSHDPALWTIGETYVNQAGAYISDDARFEPEINPDGTPGDEHIDGSATASASTRISPIEIVKEEPNSEGEIMRGVHDHKTVYTLTVTNNEQGPTDSIRVEDYLPAGLEFLGCGGVDNTSNAFTNPGGIEEYPGSGLLSDGPIPSAPSCVLPDTVETVNTDPDGAGPLTAGVYTHVVWNDVANLAVDGTTVIQYVAGIPLRANTMSWTGGGLPPATDGAQGSNLDNNSGPETFDEQELRNYAVATGTYSGSLQVSDDDSLLRHAEDLAIHKGVDNDSIVQASSASGR